MEKNYLLFTQPIANYVKKIMINQREYGSMHGQFLQTKILSLTWKNKLLLEIIIILFFKSKFLSNQNNYKTFWRKQTHKPLWLHTYYKDFLQCYHIYPTNECYILFEEKKYDSTCSIQTNLMKKIYVYLLSSYYI